MDIAEKQAVLAGVLEGIAHLPCWKVNCGSETGASFKLAFGKRVPRRVPRLVGKTITEQVEDDGEASLLVWCDWRLDTDLAPVTSSDDAIDAMQRGLGQ